MAQKQTTHDAVSAAMSAIEEALNLSADESPVGEAAPTVSSPDPGPGPAPAPAPVKSSPVVPPPLAAAVNAPPARDPGEPPPPAHRQPPQLGASERALGAGTPPANDDRAAIGPIVQALQSRRPSRAPFVAAAVAALVWLALCALYAVLRLPPPTGMDLAAARDYLLRPETVLLALAALGPTILFFGFATLARRMRELRGSANSIAQVALRLAEPETTAGDQLVTLSQAIRREIASMGDGVERALARAAELETLVRSEVSTLERAYADNERRIRSLIAEMADQREAIVANGSRVQAALDEAHRGIADDLEAIAERLAERVSNVGERVAASLGECNEGIATALSAKTEDARAVLDAAGATWSEHFAARNEELRAFIDESAGALSAQIDESGRRAVAAIFDEGAATQDRLREASRASVAEWNEQAAQVGEKFAALAGEAVASIGVSGDSLHDALVSRIASLEETLGARGGALVVELAAQTGKLDEQLNSLAGLVGDGGESVLERIGAHVTRLGESLGAQTEAIDAIMSSRQAELDDRLTDHHARFEQASNARLTEFDNASVAHQTVVELALTTHAGVVNDAVRDGLANFETTFAQRSEELISRLDAETKSLTTQIDGKLSTIEEAIVAGGRAVDERLEKRAQDSAALFESEMQAAERNTSAKLKELAASLEGLLERIDSGLAARGMALNETLVKNTIEIARGIGDGVDRFRDQVVSPLQALSTQFDDAVSAQGDAFHTSIAGLAERVGASFSSQREAIAATLTTAIDDLNAALAGRGDEIAGNLAARIEELRTLISGPDATDFMTQLSQRGTQISSQITGVSERAAQAFEYQTSGFIALMTRRSEDLIAAINASATDSAQSLGALTGQLSSEVEQSGAAVREAVERNAGATVTALVAAGERLRYELSQVLDRLGQAGSALDRVVDGAGGKLGAIQGELGEKIDEMQRALGAMAAQVSELDQLSSTTQIASGSLVERMAASTAALAEVSGDLAAKQQTLDQALERRHASLRNLLAEIDAKSREFDAAASRFAASFEESFNRAQERAQEISAALALATKGTASSVVNQFEMIRENAGAERERTAQALEAAYEQANAQLSEIMNDTADRFRQSVAEVKQMAGEVQRHLDATRQELRRGVFELPAETNEAASAMRRVVSDQIKALRELTAVVTASGADFDVAEPAAAPSRAAARIADPARDDGRAPVVAASAAEPARSLAKPARPRAPQAVVSAPPTAPSTVERGQSGWLSNLLAAASRDEAPSAPGRAVNDTLEGISMDIAKFVDAEAAAEMWDRWRSGDTTAVSRRLYTAQGQQTFDEVRRRFRNDPQFQLSVTRYTQEFERLLAKIGQTDRDGAQSRATLLSDAGKVYTMLAHASGRLG